MDGEPVEPLRIASPRGRGVVAATVLGSGMAALDATVVNVALPRIGGDFGAGMTRLEWVVNAYTLTLAGFLLLGGALGDRHGRRRMFLAGTVGFAIASLACAAAPTIGALIAARAIQGTFAALLTPGSLAVLQSSFDPRDRAAAVGAWSGLGGVATAIGPLAGGYLVDAGSWRLIFVLNVPLAAAVVVLATRYVPETRDPTPAGPLDVGGALLGALGLAGLMLALTDGPTYGWSSWPIVTAWGVGGAAPAAFVTVERRRAAPMLPFALFRAPRFRATNLVTFVVYAALGGVMFLLPIELQRVCGYSALGAGASLFPLTLVMLLFSARAGRLSARIGPRLPMTVGPLLAAAGIALLMRIGPGASFAGALLPAVIVLAFGLALTVAPLTATVLSAVSDAHVGVASAINNDVARTAALLAVAVLPMAAGIAGSGALEPASFDAGFRIAMAIASALAAIGGGIAFVSLPSAAATRGAPPMRSCAIDGPPLRP